MPNSTLEKNYEKYLKINQGIFYLWLDLHLGKKINNFIKN